ncbi:MAG: tRNA 2-thiocytidine(32) synthetase TtcA, partial [Clostridia bacterium]|nr:tRNA 2-thiocytidine(32) synthetase TtcA [Clostridia bacterium]
MKRILGLMRKAIQKYNMIQPGDRIAVAVSGGKDSIVLLDAMNRLKCFYPLEFEIGAIYIDIGFESNAELPLRNYCDKNNIEFCVSKSSIKTIAFDIEKAKSPCSLCSRMR